LSHNYKLHYNHSHLLHASNITVIFWELLSKHTKMYTTHNTEFNYFGISTLHTIYKSSNNT